jgi:hypothetical protein
MMMMFLIQHVLLPLMIFTHPYFVSVTEIDYRSKEKELGISCKFYTDDLEEALKKFSKDNIDLQKGDKNKNQQWISAYIGQHFKIIIAGKQVPIRFIGFENDQEATWCYFEAENITPFKKIDIEADFLYEIKKEQVNLVHVTIDGNRKSSKLSNPDKLINLVF